MGGQEKDTEVFLGNPRGLDRDGDVKKNVLKCTKEFSR